jgi:hypothetical protein
MYTHWLFLRFARIFDFFFRWQGKGVIRDGEGVMRYDI